MRAASEFPRGGRRDDRQDWDHASTTRRSTLGEGSNRCEVEHCRVLSSTEFFPADHLDFAISKVNIELLLLPVVPSPKYLDDEDGEDRETMRGDERREAITGSLPPVSLRLIPVDSRAGVDIFTH